jgi:hypothetical protein
MYKTLSRSFAIVLAGLSLALAFPGLAHAATPAVGDILKKADAFRLSEGSSRVTSRVSLYKNWTAETGGTLDKERLYEVLIKPGRRSLVLFQSKAEAGQKVLMLDDKYWLLLPKTRRPVRITASQKLLGEASTGDIATLTWAEDYTGTMAGEMVYGDVPALRLNLESKVKGASYHRIEAIVKKADFQPLHAKLFLKSGKLAKEAIFVLGELNGRPRIVQTVLLDRINKKKRTVIDYLSMQSSKIPDKYYNPAYLQRNPKVN